MADNDKPVAPDVNEILKALNNKTPLGGKRTDFALPKPMILGSIIPKGGPSGPPNFKPKDVVRMLKDINVDVERVHNAGANTYITYKVPGQKNEDMGDQPPQIRVPNPNSRVHAGSPKSLENPELMGMNFIDAAGQHTGEKLPEGMFGKFIKNQQGDYYNNLDAIKNAVLWRTGQGLVPPGTAPNKPYVQQSPVKIPPDPNQLDFMHKLYENAGTQKPNNIVGGNPENLWHSGQMPQKLPNVMNPTDLGVFTIPTQLQPSNYNFPKRAPKPEGMTAGQYGTYNQQYLEMLRLLEKSKNPPGEPTPEQ